MIVGVWRVVSRCRGSRVAWNRRLLRKFVKSDPVWEAFCENAWRIESGRERPGCIHFDWTLGRERLRGTSGSPTADLLHHRQRRGCRLDWRCRRTGGCKIGKHWTLLVSKPNTSPRSLHFALCHDTRYSSWQQLVQRGRKCDSRQEQQRHRLVLMQTSRSRSMN
jgi:hypothetical protein